MPIYKGTSSDPIQRVYKGDKECYMFKGDSLVHPSAVMYSTAPFSDWTTTPANFIQLSQKQVHMSLSRPASPIIRGTSDIPYVFGIGSIYYFKVSANGYYDITWKARYVYASGGVFQNLRILKYIQTGIYLNFVSEVTLSQSDSILVLQTPVDIETSVRRTFLTTDDVILVVSSVPSSLMTESNAIVTIKKVP